jgi:hypothetical protein
LFKRLRAAFRVRKVRTMEKATQFLMAAAIMLVSLWMVLTKLGF